MMSINSRLLTSALVLVAATCVAGWPPARVSLSPCPRVTMGSAAPPPVCTMMSTSSQIRGHAVMASRMRRRVASCVRRMEI